VTLPAARESEQPGGSGAGKRPAGELALRVRSALVLGVGALAVTAFGGLPFLLFWTGAALWMWWEWVGIVRAEPRPFVLALGGVAIAGMAVALAFDQPAIAFISVIVGTAVAAASANRERAWTAAGVVYGAVLAIACVMLRADPAHGLAAILWLFTVVWAADIAAYFTGRAFGGPLLAPSISPKKTWSGTLGGALAGVLAGSVTVVLMGLTWRAIHLGLALLIVAAAQIGDLFESAMKRRFGVKDASQLIPGHGGLMDRLDGFLAAAIVALAIGLAFGGANRPATGLLAW
jgi:phosphatidate cytidylyltransferase